MKPHRKKLVYIRKYAFLIYLIGALFLISCQSDNGNAVAVEKETIESFSTRELEMNNDGLYEPVGYTKVNSITYIKENKHIIITHVRAVEDYYDLNDNYNKTVVVDSFYEKLKINHYVTSYDKKYEVAGPLTIHTPDHDDLFSSVDLTSNESEDIKNHILKILAAEGG
ncbi:hypothetical protein ACFP56_10505 [Paenibacillus septentrionalis]|uniref:DUF4367 domain-containing protein n=1 Tax=Paenibacillus septentrionalis TaxID=429342 RepID=A0ABW1V5M3_9BACL